MSNKKFLETDDYVKKLENTDQLNECLDYIRNDLWIFPYINECAMVAIDKPLFYSQFKNSFELEKFPGERISVNGVNCTDEEMDEVAQHGGNYLVFPMDNKMQVFPTRYTAFTSICGRAGLSGSTIYNFDSKSQLDALPNNEKTQWLSRGFSLHKAMCKILLREGKISAMLSQEYEILPPYEILPKFEEKLKMQHPGIAFETGLFSHEYLLTDYMLNNDVMENSFLITLRQYGFDAASVKCGVRFTTSDIGNSQVTAAPFFVINNVKIRLGKPIMIRHDSGNTVNDFLERLPQLAVSFDEAEDQIETLGNIEIKYPTGCIQHILLDKKSLPKSSVLTR